MKLKTVSKLGVALLLSTTVLAACGNNSGSNSSAKPNSKTLNWTQTQDLTTVDPSKVININEEQTTYNSNQGVLKLSKDKKGVQPAVAKSYKVSKDGKTYTFDLRNSKWSNGTPVTAQDFVYGVQRSADPKTASQDSYYLNSLKNGKAVTSGKMPVSSIGVKAVGKYKVVYTLDKPQEYFKYLLTLPVYYPQSQAAVQKYGKKYGTNSKSMLYNGPFKISGWTGSNDNWSLVKNNQYWNKNNVKLNRVNFNVIKDANTGINQFEAGKLDQLTLTGKSQVNNYKRGKDVNHLKTDATFFMVLNQKKVSAFKNVNIRKAISMAIDRQEFTKDVLGDGSTPAKGFVGSGIASKDGQDFSNAAYQADGVEHNLTQAKQLFKKGLNQLHMKKLSFTILADDSPLGKASTELLQSQLKHLPNLTVNNSNLPSVTKSGRVAKGQFDVDYMSFNPSVKDPISVLNLARSGYALNFGKYSNSKYDSYLDKAENQDANNYDKRWNDLVQAHKILMNTQGVIPIYQQGQTQLLKDNVKGVQYFQNGPTLDFENARITK